MTTTPSTPPARTWLAVYQRNGRILHLDAASIDAVRIEDDRTLTVWRRKDQVGTPCPNPSPSPSASWPWIPATWARPWPPL